MDKSERETHDFMNVESFSQLPFIRPAPPSPPLKEKGIRLFGKEFGGADAANSTTASATGEESELVETNTCEDTKQENNENSGGDCGRRFECHYCCRNFPTSQALGGHQNAHKRERQHAKRAHLQSAMVHTASSFSADAHMYGALMNYRQLAAGSPPTWNNNNNNNNNTNRYYGSQYGSFSHHHHHQPPINGSPLALWRIPTATPTTMPSNTSTTFNNRDRLMHHHSPLFSGDEMMKPSYGAHGGGGGGGGSSSQSSRYIYETKPSVQDHVSLDLHL